jgi:phosphoribosylanthranilate isomerase
MRTRLKVCCIASPDEAAFAIRLGADALGLVGPMPSGPGPIDESLIAEIAAAVPPPIATFLLTCATSAADILPQVRAAGVDTVQLVDEVDDDVYPALRRELPHLRIVQVLHVQDSRVLDDARRLQPHVHAFLLDSGRPSAAVKELGGTGRTHDWALSARLVASVKKPVFLAGGINPANVVQAIRTVRPYAIDLCSGVRTNGRLDESKLTALVAAMHTADSTS